MLREKEEERYFRERKISNNWVLETLDEIETTMMNN